MITRILLGALCAATSASAALHPDIVLRDSDGASVAVSSAPVSPISTCGGACHDTSWIEAHSGHAWLALDETTGPTSGRPFDTGAGPLRRWDPIDYDRVDFDDDFTIGIADWLRRHGDRHVGGGFAVVDAEGRSLDANGPLSTTWSQSRADDGSITTWDWKSSGVAEMDCFLCHVESPANDARIEALREGRFGEAATATLRDTDVITFDADGWRWNDDAFDVRGAVPPSALGLTRAGGEHCGQCHGAVETRVDEAFWFAPDAHLRGTETTGTVFAPGRVARSGMNVAGRDRIARSWDVHAERLVDCTDCHGAINNPFRRTAVGPDHLRTEVRREDPSTYLRRPRHDFVQGTTAQGSVRDELDGERLDCRTCHDATTGHGWLPYADRHFDALECSACHIPRVLGAARQSTDWTVLTDERAPRVVHRGAHGDPSSPHTLLEGFAPTLLPRTHSDGTTRLAPHNLLSTWYWFDAEAGRPVTREELEAAWFDGDAVHPSIVAALDATGNGAIEAFELALLMPHQAEAVAARLRSAGVVAPEIRAETQAYTIGHGVVGRRGATRDCSTCHGTDSRLTAEVVLADLAPGDVLPTWIEGGGVALNGEITTSVCGHVVVHPDPEQAGVYLFGSSRRDGIDTIGLLALLLVIGGVTLHGGLRVVLWTIRRQRRVPTLEPRTEGAR